MTVSKQLGPLDFEDLEPRRFKDLVRELVYDFKDWQSIEATGRGGADDGFDIRAYDRANTRDLDTEDGETGEDREPPHPMDGNLWMFQCKRESEIGPTAVTQIIDQNVKADVPPYGCVLVAPANFSKRSFDVFREELHKRGVMEFYLWGRAALEDTHSSEANLLGAQEGLRLSCMNLPEIIFLVEYDNHSLTAEQA